LTVPVGSEAEFGLVMDGGAGGLIVIESAGGVESVWNVESMTCGVKLNVPVELGVPDITPVDVLRPTPGGS